MASTYTTSLKIQEIGNGEQSGVWGTTTNTNWTLIEQAIAGVQTITMSNADYTLSNLNGVSDEARNMVLVVNGTNSDIRKVVAPLNQPKLYVISNQTTGGYAITIGASTGAYISIPNGVTAQVYTDGTNFYSAQTGSAGDFSINGNATVSGALGVTGAANLTTGAISGIMTAPTAASGTSTTQLATTAFVANALSSVTGRLIQVVSVNFDTSFSTTSGTYVNTGHTATITPTSVSSKILIILSSTLANNATNANSILSITRAGTSLSGGGTTAFCDVLSSSGNIYTSVAVNYLDSPNTISSTTYAVTVAAQSGSTAQYNSPASISTANRAVLTLLEIL